MKQFILSFSLILVATLANAQTGRKAVSKSATRVDSINTPPRMDGNTGQYDTVRRMPGQSSPKQRGSKGKVDYNYNRHTDSVRIQRKGR